MPDHVETMNRHLVSLHGDRVAIMMPPRGPISRDEALVLAAWLVVCAECGGSTREDFQRVLTAVSST